MIRKRRSLAVGSASPVKRSLSARKAPPRRRTSVVVAQEPEEVFVSTGNPKHDLILSHARAREGMATHAHGKFWIGSVIALCVLVVFLGWWATFGMSLQVSVGRGSDGLLQIIRENTQQLKEDLKDPTQDVRARLDALEAQRVARDAALKRLQNELHQAQPTSTR